MQKTLEKMVQTPKLNRYQKAKLLKLLNGNSAQHLAQKIHLVQWMKRVKIEAYKNESPNKVETYNAIKRTLISLLTAKNQPMCTSWKNALFNMHQAELRSSSTHLQSAKLFHVTQPSSIKDFICKENNAIQYSSSFGITHADSRNNPEDKIELCLDAEYQYDTTGTTVDGIGVYQNIEDNRAILKSAKLTAKYLTRLCHEINDPKELFDAIPTILNHTRRAVKAHFQKTITQSACAVMTKIFPYSETHCQVVTAGVGDCMAFAWLPSEKRAINLSSAKQYDYGLQFNPLSVTDTLTPSMIQRSRVLLPKNAVLFRMTDGAWQMLPNSTSKKQHDKQADRHYIESEIDTQALSKLLSDFDQRNPGAQSSCYRDFLTQHIIDEINTLKATTPAIMQKDIPHALEQYKAEHSQLCTEPTFAEFSPWLQFHNPNLHSAWIDNLSQLECVMDLLQDVTIKELNTAFENKIELGDDTTLSVQCVETIEPNWSANNAKPSIN